MESLSRGGERWIGYGAAAKATVMTNACGIGPKLVRFIADRNPRKQGRLTPGTHIHIVPPEQIGTSDARHMVIFAWNVADEIRAQEREFARRGGRFILPVPEPKIVS